MSRHWHGAGCTGFSSGWALPSCGCLLAGPRQATCELTALKASVSSAASVVSPHWTYTCVQGTGGEDWCMCDEGAGHCFPCKGMP